MRTQSPELCSVLWTQLAKNPTAVLDLPRDVAAQLIAWDDSNADTDGWDLPVLQMMLLRSFAGDDMVEAFDAAQTALRSDDTEGRAEELAWLIDPSRSEEAMDMVDDWKSRCGLPEELAEALRECIATNDAIFARG